MSDEPDAAEEPEEPPEPEKEKILINAPEIYRIELFSGIVVAAESYRNLNLEFVLEHPKFGYIRFLCEKKTLSPQEIDENKAAKETGQPQPHWRGNKSYNITGIVYDQDKIKDMSKEETKAKLGIDIADLFINLEEDYKKDPKTAPIALTITSIGDLFKYMQSNKIGFTSHSNLGGLLFHAEGCLTEYRDELLAQEESPDKD